MKHHKIILSAFLVIAISLFWFSDFRNFLALAPLKANRAMLVEYYNTHRLTAVAGFMAIYIAQTALSLPGAAILSLAAGAIFGPIAGTVYACVAATAGATVAFLATRYLLRDLVQSRFGRRLEAMNRELEERGLGYLLFLRLVPLFPFFLINISAGLTRMPLRTFLPGTLLGIIPGGFVIVNAGAALATVDSLADIVSPGVFASFVLLGLFALLPLFYNRYNKGGRD